MTCKLAPSILSANFAALGENIRTLQSAGAHMIHFDVMDGHFVPNLSFGFPVLESIRPVTDLPFDAHLMISNPLPYLQKFARAGADDITIHWEAAPDMAFHLKHIRSLGAKPGFAIKPATPVGDVLAMLEHADRILIMSVEPGFGGQKLIPDTLRKAEQIANFVQRQGLALEIEMDGGIDEGNVRSVLDAGVNIVVAGSAVFADTPSVMTKKVKAFLKAMER